MASSLPTPLPAPGARLDRLSALLDGLAPEVTVRPFGETGSPPGLADAPPAPATLLMYLVIRGRAMWRTGRHEEPLVAPCLVICPGDVAHGLRPDGGGTAPTIVRVEACLRGPVAGLLLDAFRQPCTVGLDGGEASLLHTVGLIAAELEQPRCGQPALLHRAGDILFIGVLRQLVARPVNAVGGILSGLADPRLARALVAVHDRPQVPWTLERLADEAGMSRTAFARHFHAVMRMPPGRYLQRVRLAIARSAVAAGRGLKLAAIASGYQSPAALSRALSRADARRPAA